MINYQNKKNWKWPAMNLGACPKIPKHKWEMRQTFEDFQEFWKISEHSTKVRKVFENSRTFERRISKFKKLLEDGLIFWKCRELLETQWKMRETVVGQSGKGLSIPFVGEILDNLTKFKKRYKIQKPFRRSRNFVKCQESSV